MIKSRVIQVTSYYPPHLGGMENCVEVIVRELSKRKYPVDVYASDVGYTSRYNSGDNPNVHYLKSVEVAHTPIMFSLFPKLLFVPKKSIIHLHISSAFSPEIVMLVSKIRHMPYIAHVHLDVDSSGFFGFLLKPYKKYILKNVLKNAVKIICLSESQKNTISAKYELPANNVEVIPNGVSENFFLTDKKIVNQTPRLLFVGRISSQKNLPLLIEAVRLMKRQVKLDIIGDGEDKEKITELIKRQNLKNITLHGKQTGSKLLEFYKKADIFVVSSKKEGVSLAMLEAMAAGLPIVGTDVPGIKELINDCGILIPLFSPEKFARNLDNLLLDIGLRKMLSKKGQMKARQYGWNKVIDQLENIYFKILR